MTDDGKFQLLDRITQACASRGWKQVPDAERDWISRERAEFPANAEAKAVAAIVDKVYARVYAKMIEQNPLAALIKQEGLFLAPRWFTNKAGQEVASVILAVRLAKAKS